MKYRELIILLPCHSWEDFPIYHTGDDAQSILACWTSLWHPALLTAAGSMPKWHRADSPPDNVKDCLVLVPTISSSQLASGFGPRAKEEGAILIRKETDRSKIVATAIESLDGGAGAADSEIVADFHALGYAFLQVQVLTRQMRYSSNLDEAHFEKTLLAGALAAVAGKSDEAKASLTSCFDLLGQDRDHYYSVDAYVLDLTLVADTTTGDSLLRELSGPTPSNIWLDGTHSLAAADVVTVEKLKEQIAAGKTSVIGGETTCRPLPLLSCEGILHSLTNGLASFEQLLGKRPTIFGRRRNGLTPFLPGVLEKLGFRGAIHATLDDGRFPLGYQIKTRWQGFDAGAVDAIAKAPLDANKPETFLSLAQKLSESMDSDHVATICLAHWPGVKCIWLDDLKRCAAYSAALGRFVTIEQYFADTYVPGHNDRFAADQYRTPYLKQRVMRRLPNPISPIMNYWRLRTAWDAAQAINTMAHLLGAEYADLHPIVVPIENDSEAESSTVSASEVLDHVDAAAQRFAARLPSTSSTETGTLIVNPLSFARKVPIAGSQPQQYSVIEVPSMGYSWVASTTAVPAKSKDPILVDDQRTRDSAIWMRNEFCELSISPTLGSLQTMKDYRRRSNRLSQQLALRIPGDKGKPGDTWRDPDELASYTVMAADEVIVTAASTTFGEVVSRGRLLLTDGTEQARFQQTYRIWRGLRIVEVDIELEPLVDTKFDPWNSYFALRTAWADENAEIYYSVNQTRQPTTKQRLESPLYVDIESGELRSTLLTGGLPYHRRVGTRMLDSLLIVRGEEARRFRLGIGLDVPQAWHEALSFLAPVPTVTAPAPRTPSSWLWHIDVKSVVATHWSPLIEDGKTVGARTRLLECGGREVRAHVSTFREVAAARVVNFLGETLHTCQIAHGKITIDLAAHEWIEVEVRWN